MRSVALREDIHDLILDAADRLLARYGYKKMTMDDLAREVGIGKGTIYLHFPSKQAVVLSHIDRIVERLREQLRSIACSDQTSAYRLRRMLLTRVLLRFDSVQHYTESLSDLLAAIRPALLVRRRQHFEAEAHIFAEVLNEGRTTEALVFDDARATAFTLLFATNSLLPYSLSGRELGKRKELEEQTARIADVLLNGLLPRDVAGGRGTTRLKPRRR